MKPKKLKAIAKKIKVASRKPRVLDPFSVPDTNKFSVLTKQKDEIVPDSYARRANMFFSYNTAIKPPYKVLVDTNFVHFAAKNKVKLVEGIWDCLLAKTTVFAPECVLAELEKLGRKFRLALRSAQDPRVVKLACLHKGTYADDCIFNRAKMNNVYIVATADKALQARVRKLPGVPVMYVAKKKFVVRGIGGNYSN